MTTTVPVEPQEQTSVSPLAPLTTATAAAVNVDAADVELSTPDRLRSAALLPVLCTLPTAPIARCQVTATVIVDGQAVVVGRGSANVEGRPSAHKLAVPVELTDLARELLAEGAAMTVGLDAVVQAGDTGSHRASALRQVTLG